MKLFKLSGLTLTAALVAGQFTAPAQAAENIGTIRLAEADSFSSEDLVQLIAYARATQRGVKVEVSSFKSDDILFQAVLNGQIDVGVGDSYEGIHNLKAPLTNIYQLRKLAYVPVVDKTVYPTWKSLDGKPFAVHSRGSGTEILAQIMEKKEGVKFSQITYLPGSEVRVVAMQRGTIKATYLDLPASKQLLDSNPQRFGALPAQNQDSSDSTLYLSTKFLQANPRAVQILLEELIKSARATAADPSWPAKQRKELNLLPDMSEKEAAGITDYFKRANDLRIFPTDGGAQAAANADLEFLTLAGKLPAQKYDLKEFWDFKPLGDALKAVGSK